MMHECGKSASAIVCAALALAKTFLQKELGVTPHPEKTRIVHVRDGFEFLGYKIKRGKGLRMAAHQRTSRANPLNLYAIPRARSVDPWRLREWTRPPAREWTHGV
jgi:RNA-directed DNA polymerase